MDSTSAAAAPIKDATTATFMQDVVDASAQIPVIVDFWAPWCGPCKQLGPLLEKVVTEANGAVRLVKVDIDQSPEVAQSLRVQSIPAVFAFKNGQPVDGFVGALPESQIRAFVAKLVGGPVESPIAQALEQAKALVEGGELGAASALFNQILSQEPGNPGALAGLARCYLATDNADKARQLLADLDDAQRADPDVASVLSALDLAEQGAEAGAPDELEARVAADANDHQARFDLAVALYGAGQRERAIDALLEIVRRDREWNDQAARKQLLKFFDAMGATDPLTLSGRRGLSSILFS